MNTSDFVVVCRLSLLLPAGCSPGRLQAVARSTLLVIRRPVGVAATVAVTTLLAALQLDLTRYSFEFD